MNYVSALYRGIDALIEKLQQNPFDFLCERDIQSTLFSLLVAEFGDERIEMQGGNQIVEEYGGSNIVQTVPVKCEYLSRFDIAVIDPETIRHYNRDEWIRKGFKSDAFWNQPLLAAVELKYCCIGGKQRRYNDDCQADIQKLRNYLNERGGKPFLGISLLFIQSNKVEWNLFGGRELNEKPENGFVRYIVTRQKYLQFHA